MDSADKPAGALSQQPPGRSSIDRDGRRGQLCPPSLPPADSGRRTNELTGPRPDRSSRVLESPQDGCHAGRVGWGAVSETPRERQPMMAVDGFRRLEAVEASKEANSYNDRQLRIWSGTKTQVGRRNVEHRPA